MPSVIPEWAAKYIGLEYSDKGRGPFKFDCWGLVKHIERMENSVELPDFRDLYQTSVRDPSVPAAFAQGASDAQKFTRLSGEAPQAFDIVVLNIAGRAAHCGVMVSATHFLHIHAGTGSCIDAVSSPRWAQRVEGFYRPAGR